MRWRRLSRAGASAPVQCSFASMEAIAQQHNLVGMPNRRRTDQCRTGRGALGHRGGRVVLRDAEERDVPPPAVRNPEPGTVPGRRVHRSVLQLTNVCVRRWANAPHGSARRVSKRSNSFLKPPSRCPRTMSKNLAALRCWACSFSIVVNRTGCYLNMALASSRHVSLFASSGSRLHCARN